MSPSVIIVLAALPWVVIPAVILWRLRDSASLDAYPAQLPADAPLLSVVSVVLPARNEAHNIEACLVSILATAYPNIEVIVVDDHSHDGTGDIARRIAATDARVQVINNPDLPDGWFGKQWACHNGARAATGALLCFTDADTRHGPELLSRSVNAMIARRADLFSVAGSQTMLTFWEKVIQPHIFVLLFAKYGGTEKVSRSANPYDKIANGQYLLMRRDTYDRTGGHETVRTHVAEDLRMAQEWCRLGFSVQFVTGLEHMSTRMYEGLGEIIRGWGKNVYAAGRDSLDLGPIGHAVLRVIFPLPALWEIVPIGLGVGAVFGVVPPAVGIWGALVYAITALYWGIVHALAKQPVWWGLLHPLASVMIFIIFTRAAWKGDRVEWKGRAYQSK